MTFPWLRLVIIGLAAHEDFGLKGAATIHTSAAMIGQTPSSESSELRAPQWSVDFQLGASLCLFISAQILHHLQSAISINNPWRIHGAGILMLT